MNVSPGSSEPSAFSTVSPPTPESKTPIGALAGAPVAELLNSIRLRTHVREQNDIADGGRVRQEHRQSIDTHAETCGRRHAVFERTDVVRVVEHGLFVAAFLARHLRAEARGLVFGVVQLR